MWLFHFNIITATNSSQSGSSAWTRIWNTWPSLWPYTSCHPGGRELEFDPMEQISTAPPSTEKTENRVVTHSYKASTLKWRQEDQDPDQGHLQLYGGSEGRLRPYSHPPTTPPIFPFINCPTSPREHRLSCSGGRLP